MSEEEYQEGCRELHRRHAPKWYGCGCGHCGHNFVFRRHQVLGFLWWWRVICPQCIGSNRIMRLDEYLVAETSATLVRKDTND